MRQDPFLLSGILPRDAEGLQKNDFARLKTEMNQPLKNDHSGYGLMNQNSSAGGSVA